MQSDSYTLVRNPYHQTYQSCLECLRNIYPWETPEGASNINKDFNDEIIYNLDNLDINSILKDPAKSLTESEMFAIYYYSYKSDNMGFQFRKGRAGVYDCYLDYYYSGWKKLGKSATTPLFLGINGDDQLKAMNIFDANGNYIGEGKTVVTNTITSFSEVFGSSSGFVKNKYQVALNLSKSKIPKSIEILSHYKNEKEYNVPPMYEIKLGKATTKYCVPITTINICKDTDQQNDVYKPFLVIEATEVGLGEPIFRAPEEMPTYAKLYLSVENGLKVITALTGTSLGVVGWFFVIFIILCILYCMGKCCGSTSDNYHSGSGVIV